MTTTVHETGHPVVANAMTDLESATTACPQSSDPTDIAPAIMTAAPALSARLLTLPTSNRTVSTTAQPAHSPFSLVWCSRGKLGFSTAWRGDAPLKWTCDSGGVPNVGCGRRAS